MIEMNDFSRQINILNPEEFITPIHIIGAGATGSWLAFSLAKMGIKNITIYDFDEIGIHNLPNQMFGLNDVDKNKATSIRNIIKRFTGFDVKGRNVKVDGTQPLQGIVFMLTDTMSSRKKIFEMAIKNNPNIDLLIETRMDLRGGRIYAIDPKDREIVKLYMETLYDDDEAEVSACGVSQTVLPTALGIVSNAIWKLLNYINKEEFPSETLIDFSNEIIMTQQWKKKQPKKMIKEEDINDKMIHCKTQGEADLLVRVLNELGYKWSSEESLLDNTKWYIHKENTYYRIYDNKEIKYGNVEEIWLNSQLDINNLIKFFDLLGED